MRTTPIGIVMLSDEREHVHSKTDPKCMEVLHRWAEIIRNGVRNLDGSAPEVVKGSQIITSPPIARKVGEEMCRANCKQIIMCYFVWNFPYLVWPFINTVGRDKPILSLSNNSGEFPGNVGLLATDGVLRQIGVRTHRIVGDMEDPEVQSKVFSWIRAAQAFTLMRNEVYGMYGGHSMADEVAIMNLGVLQQLGDAHEIFNRPANLFVAGFIGSPPTNFMDCTLTEKNRSCFLDAGTFILPIPDDISKIIKEKATGSELILGVRPEDISLGKRRTPEKLVEAEVYVTEPLGSEVIVDLKVGDNLVKAKTTPDFAISIGEKVWMGFNKERMHLFDKKTEKAII